MSLTVLPPLGLRFPAQRGYCDQCRLEDVAAGRYPPAISNETKEEHRQKLMQELRENGC